MYKMPNYIAQYTVNGLAQNLTGTQENLLLKFMTRSETLLDYCKYVLHIVVHGLRNKSY